jgi:thiamine-monophosphate kinase
MAANVSDCAAMAALPDAALVLLVFPKNAENLKGEITGIYRGFRKACRKWKFRVVGGDLSCGRVWTIGITMLGTAPGRVLRRKGIRAGDVLWGSGFPGRSAAGLAAIKKWGRNRAERRYPRLVCSHIAPSPPLELGIALGRCRKTHAMMDLSDGISKDARTLCFENRLGLQLSFDDIKVPEDMLALGRELKISWQEWALHGGEDYTLLFAASRSFGAGDVPEKFRSGLVRLGMFTDEHKELVLREVGRIKKIPAKGWDHTGR